MLINKLIRKVFLPKFRFISNYIDRQYDALKKSFSMGLLPGDYSYSVCSLLSCLKVPLDVFPHRYCLTDQNRWSSLIICYHHWGHAHMDWDNPHSKPPFYDYFTYFIGVIFLIMSWVIIHYHYMSVCYVCGDFSGWNGKPAYSCLQLMVGAVFKGRGFIEMPNIMVKSEMLLPPVSLAKQ